MLKFIANLFNHNEKVLRRFRGVVEQINGLEPELQRLSDAELAGQTGRFRERLERGETLEQVLPEAFATVREASRRVLGMRHFDVQMIGGMALHEGNIAEMRTGEGKTLVATLPSYLNALPGKGVHVVTVNDYLARRDAEWMGRLHRFLGLEVGLIVHGLTPEQRRASYAADITYGTNNEFGFDYLRDNMVLHQNELVQRPLHYAIVDEVDSILIDEARTPLIISGPADKPTDLYYKFAAIANMLQRDVDYTVDEKAHTVAPTEEGVHKVEQILGVEHLYADERTDLSHYLNNALKAKELYRRDHHYVVRDGEVTIVDEFTGRLMFGRRWSDGLHQAVEAKEGVKIERETVTLATITLQNYFRMYKKLSGMTGTAATEEEEFRKIYGMDVIIIPTNRPLIRKDLPDVVYKTEAAKFRAVIEDIVQRHQTGQPVLVGTISIEKSELLSEMLKKRGIKHQVLNAKYHEKEAEIIAQAGRMGAVTIATNMAGRGTDILLGGNPEFLARERLRARGYAPDTVRLATEQVTASDRAEAGEQAAAAEGGVAVMAPPEEIEKARAAYRELLEQAKAECAAEHERVAAAGGLAIIGTERHESRRIDNQLRGRAGRQGDPGCSRFYVALNDDLMRLFGGENVANLMDRLGIEEDMPIDHPIISRAIENAQKRVEARNFDIRKHILQYDDVMNHQRAVIYEQRRRVLEGENLREAVLDMAAEIVKRLCDLFANEHVHQEEWDLAGLIEQCEQFFLPPGTMQPSDLEGMGRMAIQEVLTARAREVYEAREVILGGEIVRQLERFVMLRVVDEKWVDHLTAMDDLREGVGLRAYGQRDPLIEYKMEAYEMFQSLIQSIQEDTVRTLYHVDVVREPEPRREVFESGPEENPAPMLQAEPPVQAPPAAPRGIPPAAPQRPPLRVLGPTGFTPAGGPGGEQRIGRNDPCPCGSGKKYKKCCGQNEQVQKG